MVLLNLFLTFFRIGLFAIGGAYSFLPIIEKEVVEKYQWLTKAEFLEVLGAVQVFPGAISIKFATYTGYKLAGIPGVIFANLGNLLAPAVLIIFATVLYNKCRSLPGIGKAFAAIQLAIFAMIIAVGLQLINLNQLLQFKGLFIVVVSFLLFMFTRIHPALIIVGAGVLGAIWR